MDSEALPPPSGNDINPELRNIMIEEIQNSSHMDAMRAAQEDQRGGRMILMGIFVLVVIAVFIILIM